MRAANPILPIPIVTGGSSLTERMFRLLIAFFRTLILYAVIVFGVRLMGKRQLGELQPSELVVTILISNIATLPIEEIDTPLFLGMLPILSLVTFEIIMSTINLKSHRMRKFFSGSPVIVICNGVINQQSLSDLRFSVDDLMAQLRDRDIYAIEEVDFAVVETTGKLSVYQKFLARTASPEALSLPDQPDKNSPPLVVISDGVVNEENLRICDRTKAWLESTVASHHLKVKDVLLMTTDKNAKVHLVAREARR